MKTASLLSCRLIFRCMLAVIVVSNLCFAAEPSKTPPDLTQDRAVDRERTYNLGATGLRGWIHTKPATHFDGLQGRTTAASRQILVTHVGAKSPADGVLQVDDVILGVGGRPFSDDARKSFALAIQDAEKESSGGVLKLTRWRAGKTEDVQLKLRVLGTYSATAPYDCPKSKKIFEEACVALEKESLPANWHGAISGLALLATGNDAYRPRLQKLAQEIAAHALKSERVGMVAWESSYRGLFLCEYYLATNDAAVLPAINAITVSLAHGQSLYGTFGHGLAPRTPEGKLHGSVPPYGPVNQVGLTANLAIVFGKKCGVLDEEVAPAIERAANFFGYFAGKGTIPYGEHEPWPFHDNNGKSAMSAVLFGLQDNRVSEAQFFSKMTVASYRSRECGHTGQGFSYLWGALGADIGGPAASAAFFKESSWHLDLVRRSDGSFTYDGGEQYGPGQTDDNTYYGKSGYFGLSPNATYVLTYALPLKKLLLTGKEVKQKLHLTQPEIAAAVTSARFDTDRKTKTLPELMTALGDWSPVVRSWAAEEIITRPDAKTLIPELLKLAEGPDKHARQGACETLANMRSIEALPILIRALSHEDRWLRFKAAQGLRRYGADAKPFLHDILKVVAKTAEPLQPINWADPVQLAQGQLAATLFEGPLTDSLKEVDGAFLYPAIRAIASNADGMARAKLRRFFENKLTVDDVQALAPDIYAAVKTPSPADTMFGNEIRMGGFKALTKYYFQEGVEVGVMFAKTQGGHGSENRTGEIMKEIAKYGTAAKHAIPGLKELIADFNAQCDRGEYPKGELNNRRVNAVEAAIKTIEAATDHPELRSIKPTTPQEMGAWKHSGSMWLLTTPDGANLPADAKVEQFPVLVRLHRDWFDFTQAKPNGDDLRFSTSTGERLAFQIEEWDAAKGIASVWVRVPLITGNSRQEIKLHWGNANAASESDGKAVFNESNGYLAVWHMNDPVRDDTGSLTSTDTGTTATQGVIGAARHFADRKGVFGGEKIETLPTDSNPHSTEAWFRAEKPNGRVLAWGNEHAQGKVVMHYMSPPHVKMECYFSGADVRGKQSIPLTEWVQVVHTYEKGDSRLYVNGVLDATTQTQSAPLALKTPARLFLGGWYHNYDYVGDLDEVRISKVVRSPEWVKLQFENQKPTQTFVGSLVQPGNEFSVSHAQLVLAESQSATITAKAGGAQKVLWILKRDGRESIVATDRLAYAFNAGRVSSLAPQKNEAFRGAKGDNGLSATLTVKAIYPNEVKSKDIPITISDDIPEPIFTLAAPAKWDGRETIEVVPQISNLAAMKSKGAGDVNVNWTVDDIAVIKRVEAGKLILKRAQGIGAMRVTAAIDNGGAKVVQSINIAVTEPTSKDVWVPRPLAETEQPEDNQFISRHGPNRGGEQFGSLVYAGTLAEAADAVFVRVFADDQPFMTETAKLGADKKYSLTVKLKLGLIKYRTEFGSKTGDKETVLHTAKNIVCGDAYLIIGQSNAVATDFGKENPLVPSDWVRTFGATAGDPNGSRLKLWANAEARSPGGKSEIGYWGMELGRRLVESEKIPVCFINGAVGGTRIDQHQRNNADPTDASTIYGRQLWRTQQAKLTHGIRAVLWHQGENDQGADGPTGGYGYETYRQYFVDLAASWKEDYPNIQHYYAFQIWPKSCAMGINGSDNRLREVQRTLPKLFSNLSVISTLGIKPPGGCHYPAAGYAEFARFLHPMMQYHLYHRHVDAPFDPPNLKRAFFTSAQRDELVLEFDYHINWSDSLVSQFHLDGEAKQVVAGSANANKITLKLKGPTKSKTVTYLDSANWNPDNLLYGQNGLAALTFCDVPIEHAFAADTDRGEKAGGPALATDKTLVSWVCLANTTQQGGSALTIQSGDRFDGIVFGERVAGKWMAGSEVFARTQGDQQANVVEKADNTALLQMAIVYKGSQIAIYRNGEPCASYEASNADLLHAQNQAVFGLRHEGAGAGQTLKGSIEEARIYDKALTVEEIRKLETNKESGIKPYALWTFEKGMETDRMGRFPVNTLSGGAKIEGGRLVLASDGATLIAAGKAAHTVSPDGLVTPGMPENPPANWLTYHLIHPGPGRAEPGDPNCAFYWKGRYHLFYIYGQDGGPAFAHVSSTDMVHWKWHPTTLTPKSTGHGMYSGTGFITKDGKPAIIYHGAGSGRNHLAFALDDNLEKWTKPQPVMPEPINGKIPEMRHWDPDCWLNGDTYYAISGGGNPPLLKSKDLQKWDYIGDLLHKDMPTTIDAKRDEDISCGNMFKIGNKWMLLCINHGRGCRYYLGDFKDEKYLPDFHAMMSWNGNNYFAPESVLTKDGRRVMWAWIMGLPIAPTGVQSLPRELELPKDGALRIRPLKELEDLRYGNRQEKGITVMSDAAYALKEVSGDAIELELTVKAPGAKEFGLDVLCDKDGKNGLRIAVAGESKLLKVGKVEAPFELKKDEDLVLRVFIDKNFVEVFANDRQAAVAAGGPYAQAKTGVTLFSKGGDTVVTRVQSWKMKSIYAEAKAEEKNQAMADSAIAEDAKAVKSQKNFKGPVKVFILAGQSNMEGPANIGTFDYIGDDPATAPLLKTMRSADGKPVVCDGAWISYLTGVGADNFELHGKLSAGYGSMWGQDRTKPGVNIGPEFTFGLAMDAAFAEPVLIIKAAWGGKSLNTDFRSPSAGPYVLPKETQEAWDKHPQGAHGIPKAEDRPKWQADKTAATGVYYRLMIEHVKKVLADPKQVMPNYDPAQGYEIAGFAWLQGWNDAVDGATYPRRHQPDGYAMYSELLAHFIRDVRKDLDAPQMPFVIGVMGVGGLRDQSTAGLGFRKAMAAPADMPEFKGNVAAVQTAPFWADELADIHAKHPKIGEMRSLLDSKHKDYANADGKMTDEQKNAFMKKFEADLISPAEVALWKRGASNAGYHYLGCAKTFALMGKHFAEANLKLIKQP